MTLGQSIPSHTPHAISVSLPTWRDNVGYEEGEKRVIDAMVSGYPRFFIHPSIQKLSRISEQKFGKPGERCFFFPTKQIATYCRTFMLDRSNALNLQAPVVRLVQSSIWVEDKTGSPSNCGCSSALADIRSELHMVFFPADYFPIAKEFWQHTGTGISSREAEFCLSTLLDPVSPLLSPKSPISHFPSKNKHYAVRDCKLEIRNCPSEALGKDEGMYVEERYGRNLSLALASSAKRALRRRIAGFLVRENKGGCCGDHVIGHLKPEIALASVRMADITEDDVFLFPSGMCAIWHAHQLALAVRPPAKSVCFGFPYTDTIKILQKWGPGCHFLGHGLDSSIDELERILETSKNPVSFEPPILALFTEFPSNPLLRSADLPRLRSLADKHDFLIVVDETVGNFINVQVLQHADIVVSSLTKVFSGDSNVMGGSLVLNPKGQHYAALKTHLTSSFEDLYFDEDVIYMERNSRDFEDRIKKIDANAEVLCDFLHSRSLAGGAKSSVIKNIFYPKWETREHYNRCRVKDVEGQPIGGFGGLFSLTFTSSLSSQAFFDALPCHKGPSLGTNFTLVCPYTILAHYAELQWAAEYGVEESLVRVSVGMENQEDLLQGFELALKAAEAASGNSS